MDERETLERNKEVVVRFNREVIEKGDEGAFRELMAPDFVNRTAHPGAPAGAEGMIHTFNRILRLAFPDLTVEIHDQVAEGDKVTTRKSFYATHRGEFFGVPPSNKSVTMDVIDIIRLESGKYVEHWGILDMQSLMSQITG